ncbi:6-phosphogluconolactonase [Legionella londiniensis]|uniref:6-phosphogluconolactonase n=1 Tax=Legionella londiniensis TaxID=45068 RepID=A0A0W0VLV0_9GAMM|nr:6-phosphogluconolactonase [Legionella londiniensis]KTD21120.1 6-phosphogluconolactonase [Legionella londiniensis]STX93143.1 6-phosphogluconolactonase [Legionella londiniensis]
MQLTSYESKEILSQEFAAKIRAILSEAIALRNQAFLAVSGGQTPLQLFKILSKIELAWHLVTVTLVDERIVDVNSPESNEYWVKRYLLQGKASRANFISLHAQNINETVAALPPFDVLILGMGEDGHTASLFPCCAELTKALADEEDKAIMFTNPLSASHARITMTKKRLLSSLHIFLHIIGEKKKEVLQKAFTVNNPNLMPVCAFLSQPELQILYAPQ